MPHHSLSLSIFFSVPWQPALEFKTWKKKPLSWKVMDRWENYRSLFDHRSCTDDCKLLDCYDLYYHWTISYDRFLCSYPTTSAKENVLVSTSILKPQTQLSLNHFPLQFLWANSTKNGHLTQISWWEEASGATDLPSTPSHNTHGAVARNHVSATHPLECKTGPHGLNCWWRFQYLTQNGDKNPLNICLLLFFGPLEKS